MKYRSVQYSEEGRNPVQQARCQQCVSSSRQIYLSPWCHRACQAYNGHTGCCLLATWKQRHAALIHLEIGLPSLQEEICPLHSTARHQTPSLMSIYGGLTWSTSSSYAQALCACRSCCQCPACTDRLCIRAHVGPSHSLGSKWYAKQQMGSLLGGTINLPLFPKGKGRPPAFSDYCQEPCMARGNWKGTVRQLCQHLPVSTIKLPSTTLSMVRLQYLWRNSEPLGHWRGYWQLREDSVFTLQDFQGQHSSIWQTSSSTQVDVVGLCGCARTHFYTNGGCSLYTTGCAISGASRAHSIIHTASLGLLSPQSAWQPLALQHLASQPTAMLLKLWLLFIILPTTSESPSDGHSLGFADQTPVLFEKVSTFEKGESQPLNANGFSTFCLDKDSKGCDLAVLVWLPVSRPLAYPTTYLCHSSKMPSSLLLDIKC